MEATIGSEEIWNQKQLAKAVGTSVASARVGGQARSLESIEASLRIGSPVALVAVDWLWL